MSNAYLQIAVYLKKFSLPYFDHKVKQLAKLDRISLQWNPAITKCHGTEKKVRYSGVFVIAKTPL